jgi:uncharacterized protein YegJ (DUF2314 family)
MPWVLDDAEQRAAEAPRSFFIPPEALRASLKAGDLVKLIFRLERDDGEVAVERMWVEVVENGPYIGVLRNEPELRGVIDLDERVEFGPEHVCGYAYSAGELGYDPDGQCLLLRVAEADSPPPLLLLSENGDWEAHADDETDEELEAATNVVLWSLGYLTDRFPETAPALREGSRRRGMLRGREARWRWENNRYVRVRD